MDVLLQKNRTLILDHDQELTTDALIGMVAKHYNMTAEAYLAKMRLPDTWGGGPEIVAISNELRLPIHVYELCVTRPPFKLFFPTFELRVTACFGSPAFDDNEPLFILCCDGRYPHIFPGHQKAVGDHFLALFPLRERRNLRGAFLRLAKRKDEQFLLSNGLTNGASEITTVLDRVVREATSKT